MTLDNANARLAALARRLAAASYDRTRTGRSSRLTDAYHLVGIVGPVGTDDHRGWYAGGLEVAAPLRDPLTVTGEHDSLRRIRRHVHRDLPPAVVGERLGDELSR